MTKPTDSIRAEIVKDNNNYQMRYIGERKTIMFIFTETELKFYQMVADKINRPDPLKIVEEMKKEYEDKKYDTASDYLQTAYYERIVALEEVLKRLGGEQ